MWERNEKDGGMTPVGDSIQVPILLFFFIVAAIDGEINVKLRQRAAIIYMLGLTATMWHNSEAEHNGFSCSTMVILMVMIILIQFWQVEYLPENAFGKLIKLSPG